MANFKIEREDAGDLGRYVATSAGVSGEAEITFNRPSPGVLSANHTGSPDSMKGMGAAKALVEFMIADARTSGFKIIPRCPFVKAQFDKNPAWADLLAPAN